MDGAALIAVTTVNNDHDAVARQLAPLLRDGQIVCLIPGYVGGALEFRRALAAGGCRARVKLGEMDNFPFTGAVAGPGGGARGLAEAPAPGRGPARVGRPGAWSRPCAARLPPAIAARATCSRPGWPR